MARKVDRPHTYHAEAVSLVGKLRLPFAQEIQPQNAVLLSEQGGYLHNHSEFFRLQGVISFRSAYTQVAGSLDEKEDRGWNTLTTSVLEGLNVMDVVTVDRIVCQISTDHPLEGFVPTVTFLGTRFENFRIAGDPVKIDIDANMLGPRPLNDTPYTTDAGFLDRVTHQYDHIRSQKNLPDEIARRYNQLPSASANRESIECSLVNQVEGSFPGHSFGHVIHIPHFGKIYLATLRVEHSNFHPKQPGTPIKTELSLTMIRVEMGCIGSGGISGGGGKTNGQSGP
jgi:hypothetical protein